MRSVHCAPVINSTLRCTDTSAWRSLARKIPMNHADSVTACNRNTKRLNCPMLSPAEPVVPRASTARMRISPVPMLTVL